MSLLEVLMAIFVAAIGLLGLAALLTVGYSYNFQTETADRSAACGRSALREVQTRDMLHWDKWLTPAGTLWRQGADQQRLDPFLIDPLFVAENGAAALSFPWKAEVNPALRLPRVTLAGMYDPSDLALSKSLAARVFQHCDDLAVAHVTNDGRPQLQVADGAVQSRGDYSWMLMVTPSEMENPVPGKTALPLQQRRTFTVTVLVFYKRVPWQDGSPPSERQVKAQVRGHSVLLTDPTSSGLLDGLRREQWIMLSGQWKPAPDDPTPRPLHRWYRIVSVGNLESHQRTVTIAGPDWPSGALTAVDGQEDAVATIADNVAAVFEGIVEVDSGSITSESVATTPPAPKPVPTGKRGCVVVPNYAETVDGDLGILVRAGAYGRFMQVHDASQFPGPMLITDFAHRPDISQPKHFPIDRTIVVSNDEVKVTFSTTSRTTRSGNRLSLVFAENIGSDATVVFKGPIRDRFKVKRGPGNTMEFVTPIKLSPPFFYDPGRGNLLVDIEVTGGGLAGIFYHDADTSLNRIYTTTPNSPTGFFQGWGAVYRFCGEFYEYR